MKKIAIKIIFFLVIFGFGFSVWYSPVVFKGSGPYKIKEQIVLARNLAETGQYSMESEQNVFLPTSLVDENGTLSGIGNKLTAQFYGALFKLTSPLSPDGVVVVSIFLNCLTLVVLAFLVYKLFGYKIAGLFSAIYVLLPYNWTQIYSIGSYEVGLFFISLFFLFFILGRNSRQKNLFFWLAGIFLALAAMAREAFFLLIPILFFYLLAPSEVEGFFPRTKKDFIQKFKKISPVFIPIVLIFVIFYLPSFFSNDGGNVYSLMFFEKNKEASVLTDFTMIGHLYPDPYTYQHERDEFLENYNQKIERVGFVNSLYMKKVLANNGERQTKLWERLVLGDILLLGHLGHFFSLEESGGPFILFFALVGLFFYLKKKDKDLYKFFIFWILGTLFLLAYVVQASRIHMMDFSWAIPLLVALGVFYTASLDFARDKSLGVGKIWIFVFLAFIMVYSIFLADHVVFGKLYDKKPTTVKIENLAEKIKGSIGDEEVVAVGVSTQDALLLNYLSNKSIVIFNGATIEKLLEENKLDSVLKDYRVKYVFGYDKNLTAQIIVASEVENIKIKEVKEKPVSYFKSFLLAIFR